MHEEIKPSIIKLIVTQRVLVLRQTTVFTTGEGFYDKCNIR